MERKDITGITLSKQVEMSTYWDKSDFNTEEEWQDFLGEILEGEEAVEQWFMDGEPDCGADPDFEQYDTLIKLHAEEEVRILNPQIEMDPKVPDYWVGQKVTLPDIGIWEDFAGGDEAVMPRKDFDIIKSYVGKRILIKAVECDVDGTAEHAYYHFITPEGIEFDMNFAEFPPQMAAEFGFKGWGYFGNKLY